MMNLHEELFAKNFIVSEKRERYLSMLNSRKGRKKITDGFYHLRDLEKKYATEVSAGEQRAENIYKMLKAKGSPDMCYVISTNKEIDGKQLPLLDVLEKIVGTGDDGTFISCIVGKLGYYEGEDARTRYIFEKDD